MIRNKFIKMGAVLSFISACAGCGGGGFSNEEKHIIGNAEDGVMHLYTVDVPQELDLLRVKASMLDKKQVESDYFTALKGRMLATVNDPDNRGVGIAAPQVGLSYRLVAVQRFDKEGNPFEFFVNPEIVYYSEETQNGTEGCLSIPDESALVQRSNEIVIRYNDEQTFEEKVERVSGFTAVIFQHEIDHLNGILFTDRVTQSPEESVSD